MKIFKLVFWGLCIGLVSCSKAELNIEEETPDTQKDVWTLKVEAGGKNDVTTKALSMNTDGTIKSEWTQGDCIIAYKYLDNGALYLAEPIGSLSAETSGVHTTFSGSLTSVEGLSVGSKLRLSYPGYNSDYRGQDGTLQYISDHCNFSYAEVVITELNTDTKVISTTNASFKNVQAIWKIKFQNAEGSDINVTSVTIIGDHLLSYYMGSNVAITGSINITFTNAVNEIWVAIHSLSEFSNYVIKCVTDDNQQLSCVKKGNLQAGNYYTSTLKMEPLTSNYITEINSVADLVQLSNEVSIGKNYSGQTVTLMQDLDLSEVDNFQPIGLSATLPFRGFFNGNHKTISNLKISATQSCVGLFGYMGRDSGVKDLTLKNCTISSTQGNVGGIAGYTNGNITGCTVSGSIAGTAVVAGIAANMDGYGSSTPYSDCHFSGTVTATTGSAAGIIVTTNAPIDHCTNSGTITAATGAAGIVENCSRAVTDCTNDGDITGTCYVGGIIGFSSGLSANVSGCINRGHIKATGTATNSSTSHQVFRTTGSFAGGIFGVLENSDKAVSISNCVNTGKVEGISAVGGMAGYNKVSEDGSTTFTNCSNSGAVEASGNNAGGFFGITRMLSGTTFKQTVSSSVNTGAVSGADNVGGFVGMIIGSYYSGKLPVEYFDNCFNDATVTATGASPHKGSILGYITPTHNGYSVYGTAQFFKSYYSSTASCMAFDGSDPAGVQAAYKIIGATGVTVTPTTTEDVLHGGVKYFVSGKEVTMTLSGGSSYSAVDAASNPVTLTDNGGGSYTLTMPAADVTISAN